MKKLKLTATVNALFCVLAGLALIFLYLALSDIADGSSSSSLEWYVAGTCMIILCAFTVSSAFTVVYAFKYLRSKVN
ncbi:MAG: hypothetical protein IQL11_15685 [Bacteroidales bacterium]|nr:hypothetical protein [Bacteroidales bacterium]